MARQSKSQSQQRTSAAGAANAQGEDAVALLTADHRKVESLFEQYEQASDAAQKVQLAQQVCTELNVHTAIEEEIFYPACREKGVEHSAMDEAQVEHDGAKVLIRELMHGRPEDEYYDAKVKVLSDYIKHHVAEEERSGDGIFARANEAGVDMTQLGQRLKTRKQELTAEAESGTMPPLPVRSLGLGRARNYTQERYGDRDEQGRFLPSDERGGGRGYYASRDYQDDEGNGRGYSRGGGRGWYGDPQGHSRASEEGWESRRGGGGYSRGGRDYEDERYGSRGGGRGQAGGFGDPERHSRASEEGWEQRRGGGDYSHGGRDYEDERYGSRGGGHGGWFGDPQGHSRAAEEGWEQRRGGGGYGRGRDYEDERHGSRGGGGRGGHGGWFGDPEGHSRASEEGWEQRRGGGGRGR
jgi:Hemerythrin HHE cation binding domain